MCVCVYIYIHGVVMNNMNINNNNSPIHIMFKAQKLVALNTCPIAR